MKRWLLIICLVMVLVPVLSFAAPFVCPTADATALCNPTAGANLKTNDIVGLFYYLTPLLGGFVVGQTIVYVLFAGFRMIMSQGNTEEIEKSKTTIQWALLGFSLSLLAYILVAAVGHFLGVQDVNPAPGQGTSVGNPLNPTTGGDFGVFIPTLEKGVLEIVGVLAILIIIISGFRYILARGDDEQIIQAKAGLQWAVIGLIVALLAYVIVVAVAKLLGGAQITTS